MSEVTLYTTQRDTKGFSVDEPPRIGFKFRGKEATPLRIDCRRVLSSIYVWKIRGKQGMSLRIDYRRVSLSIHVWVLHKSPVAPSVKSWLAIKTKLPVRTGVCALGHNPSTVPIETETNHLQDLTGKSAIAIIETLRKGETPKPGSQTGAPLLPT